MLARRVIAVFALTAGVLLTCLPPALATDDDDSDITVDSGGGTEDGKEPPDVWWSIGTPGKPGPGGPGPVPVPGGGSDGASSGGTTVLSDLCTYKDTTLPDDPRLAGKEPRGDYRVIEVYCPENINIVTGKLVTGLVDTRIVKVGEKPPPPRPDPAVLAQRVRAEMHLPPPGLHAAPDVAGGEFNGHFAARDGVAWVPVNVWLWGVD